MDKKHTNTKSNCYYWKGWNPFFSSYFPPTNWRTINSLYREMNEDNNKIHNTCISKTNTPLQITLYSTCSKTHHGWRCQRRVTTYEQLWLINLLSSHAYTKLIYALNAFNNSSMFPSRWPLLVDFPSFHILNKKWATHKSCGVYLM